MLAILSDPAAELKENSTKNDVHEHVIAETESSRASEQSKISVELIDVERSSVVGSTREKCEGSRSRVEGVAARSDEQVVMLDEEGRISSSAEISGNFTSQVEHSDEDDVQGSIFILNIHRKRLR